MPIANVKLKWKAKSTKSKKHRNTENTYTYNGMRIIQCSGRFWNAHRDRGKRMRKRHQHECDKKKKNEKEKLTKNAAARLSNNWGNITTYTPDSSDTLHNKYM